MRRILSVLLAGMIGCSIFNVCGSNTGISAYTETSGILKGAAGGDRNTNIANVLLLQRWFLGDEDVIITDTKALDLNGNDRADIADFCYLKNLLLEEKVSVKEKKLIPPPVTVLDPDLPSVGTDRIPVFAINFPDCEFKYDDTTDRLQKTIFSPEDKDDPLYPMESVTAYYDRASYGRLHLEGDVFEYKAEHPISWYLETNARSLVAEIMEAFDEDLDYNDYDADDDNTLDSMILIFPDEAIEHDDNEDGSPDWWPYSTKVIDIDKYDGVTAGSFCVISHIENDLAEFNTRLAHELGHAMGLEDYYQTTDNIMTDNEGLPGPAGIELMDEGTGDLSACSKLLLGWFAEDEVQIYNGGTEEFTLTSTQYSPSCIVIPKDPSDLYLGEYFIIEYITKEANNSKYGGNGIRILHVNSEVADNGRMFKYSIYGKHYDTSNEKQRILRLVNDFGMFYPGKRGLIFTDYINGETEGFHWYNKYGNLLEDTGLTINIGALTPGPEFDWSIVDMTSSAAYYDLPEYIRGSSYKITITDEAIEDSE